MENKAFHNIPILVIALLLISVFQVNGYRYLSNISLSCKADNDLYLVLKENKIACDRYNSPEEAIKKAREGSGVLVLADGYPANNDTAEHRSWLRKIASDLIASQAECGAIREQIGEAGKGGFPPPATNGAYGTSEAPLIQTNADGVSDLLYTSDFAFLGLHEAAAATNEQIYRNAEDKLAKFLCRIQIRSEKHPELDGGWFRAFDFNRWEYWASNADAGWGAWSIETGWTQSWITTVLGLRQIKTSVWDYTKENKIERNFDALRKQMIPDEVIKDTSENKIL